MSDEHFSDDLERCGPGDAPPSDFGKRRVARILCREKPMFEQGDKTREAFFDKYLRIHKDAPDAFGVIKLGKREIVTFSLFGRVRVFRVIWPQEAPVPEGMKKNVNTNIKSHFLSLRPLD